MNTYEIDTLVQVQSNFVDIGSGLPFDPIDITLYVMNPNATLNAYTQSQLTKLSVGVWAFQIDANVSGPWMYKFQGTGNVQTTSPDEVFIVNPSQAIAG